MSIKVSWKMFKRKEDTFETNYQELKKEIEEHNILGKNGEITLQEVIWMGEIITLMNNLKKYDDFEKKKLEELWILYMSKLYPGPFEEFSRRIF